MKEYLSKISRREALTEEEAGAAMAVIMDGQATPAQIGAFLLGLAVRGETEDEVVGFARTMRSKAVPLRSKGAVDTCGTGGDGSGTFNISTITSLVVAACGVPVTKHGNRAASSQCGSADVLEALGVKVDPPVETAQRLLDEVGWTFLFAPAFHASTRHAVGPRKELGVRTAFNLLGPLTNPALPEAQVVGVPRPDLAPFMARCLKRLGIKRAWVVHGSGLDEISVTGPTTVSAFDDGAIETFTIEPARYGLQCCLPDDLKGGDAARNAEIAREVLGGGRGPKRDAVLLNAAAALVVAKKASDVLDGIRQSAAAIDEGRATKVLERVREVSGR